MHETMNFERMNETMPTRPTPISTSEEGSGVGLGVSLGESADSQVNSVKLFSSLMLNPPMLNPPPKSAMQDWLRQTMPKPLVVPTPSSGVVSVGKAGTKRLNSAWELVQLKPTLVAENCSMPANVNGPSGPLELKFSSLICSDVVL